MKQPILIICLLLVTIWSCDECKDIPTAKADFDTSSSTISAGESIDFTDLSVVTESNRFTWQFEGGDPAKSNDQNPTVAYTESGTFRVVLTTFNDCSEHTVSKTITVN